MGKTSKYNRFIDKLIPGIYVFVKAGRSKVHTTIIGVDASCLGKGLKERRSGRHGRYLKHNSPKRTKRRL